MIHAYLMLIIVAHTLWLCAFVIFKTCVDSDEIWTMLDVSFQYANRKPNINVVRLHN